MVQTVTRVLYCLLSHPQHIEPLRQEVEVAVAEEGWTKAGIDKMQNLDSFLRETQRIDGLGIGSPVSPSATQLLMSAVAVMSTRLAVRPFTFSNGVTIPPGTLVAFPHSAIHSSGEIYTNPEEFDGLRFSKLREKEGVQSTAHRAVNNFIRNDGFWTRAARMVSFLNHSSFSSQSNLVYLIALDDFSRSMKSRHCLPI